MKPLSSIFIIFSLLLLSCKAGKDADTQELDKYLSEHFSLKISDGAVYCFVPANQCRNCSRYDGNSISPGMNQRLVIISGFPASNFMHFNKVYYDQDNDMLRLKMLNYGNRLVICRNERVQGIIAITDLYSQLDSLDKAMAAH